jgi:hypothetical protein
VCIPPENSLYSDIDMFAETIVTRIFNMFKFVYLVILMLTLVLFMILLILMTMYSIIVIFQMMIKHLLAVRMFLRNIMCLAHGNHRHAITL